MTRTLYLVDGTDSYELIVDEHNYLREIWRYRLNSNRKPEFLRLEWLDETLRDRVNDKVMRPNGYDNHF